MEQQQKTKTMWTVAIILLIGIIFHDLLWLFIIFGGIVWFVWLRPKQTTERGVVVRQNDNPLMRWLK